MRLSIACATALEYSLIARKYSRQLPPKLSESSRRQVSLPDRVLNGIQIVRAEHHANRRSY
jgi:hypothetical protein